MNNDSKAREKEIKEFYYNVTKMADELAKLNPEPKGVAHQFQAISTALQNAISLPETGAICHCGTVSDAMTAAIRLYTQLREHQCGFWIIQIAAGLQTAYQMEALIDAGIDAKTLMVELDQKGQPIGLSRETQLLAELTAVLADRQFSVIHAAVMTFGLHSPDEVGKWYNQLKEWSDAQPKGA